MGPFLRYTAMRLGLFALALVVFRLLGAGGWLLVLLAAVASLAMSVVLLRGPRDELSAVLASRTRSRRRESRFSRRLAEDAAAEDAEDAGRTDQDRRTD